MWNKSYRTPTECWQKTSDLPKGKKLPMYLGAAKEKRKNRDKGIGMALHHWEGAVKEERFPHTRKPLHGWRLQVVEGGKFRATEESAATRVQRAKRRDSTQRIGADQQSPDRDSSLLTRRDRWGLGAEAQASESDPRERTGVGCINTAQRGLVHHS